MTKIPTTIDISSGQWSTITRTAAGITVTCDCEQAGSFAPVRAITTAERTALEAVAKACEEDPDGPPAHLLATLEQ